MSHGRVKLHALFTTPGERTGEDGESVRGEREREGRRERRERDIEGRRERRERGEIDR